jgi:hypothetical protein
MVSRSAGPAPTRAKTSSATPAPSSIGPAATTPPSAPAGTTPSPPSSPPKTRTATSNPANGNRYAYASDNPVNYTDSTGASPACDTAELVLGIHATVLTGVLGILFPPLGGVLLLAGIAADVLIGGAAEACNMTFG